MVGGILDEEDGRLRRMGKSGESWMEGIGRNGQPLGGGRWITNKRQGQVITNDLQQCT